MPTAKTINICAHRNKEAITKDEPKGANLIKAKVTIRDVAKAVLEEQDFENKMLKGYIKNWPA